MLASPNFEEMAETLEPLQLATLDAQSPLRLLIEELRKDNADSSALAALSSSGNSRFFL
jgi:hypothetical protein